MAAKKKPAKSSAEPREPVLTRFQKYVPERWRRSDIKNAPYNPRKIDSYAKKKLRENLKRRGLLQSPTVNRRTGNLIAGHQRLAIIDALEGNGDYLIDVAVCDLSPKEEREQNIFMNNPAAMGEWDLDVLRMVLGDEVDDGDGNLVRIDAEATGFDPMTAMVILGEDASSLFSTADAPPEVTSAMADVAALGEVPRPQHKPAAPASRNVGGQEPSDEPDQADEPGDEEARASGTVASGGPQPEATPAPRGGPMTPEQLAKVKEQRREYAADRTEAYDTEFYVVVVFVSREQVRTFNAALEFDPTSKFLDGRLLAHRLAITLPDPPAALVSPDEPAGE